jgi:hypothetical protein
MWPPTIVAIVNQRSADGALQQHIYVCCRCVACLNLSDLLMLSENNRLVVQEILLVGNHYININIYTHIGA